MEKSKYFLSCDLGSEYIKLVLFEVDQITKEIKPSKHIIRKVFESDLSNKHSQRCISNTLKEAIEELQIGDTENIYVNINNINLKCNTIRNKIALDKTFVINTNIIAELNDKLFKSINKNDEIVYLRINKYIIDNKIEVSDPLMMEAKSIEVDDFIVQIDVSHLDNISDNILANSGLYATSIIPGAIAQGEVLLSSQEKNLGTALIDIGYSTTDVVCYESGNISLCYTLNIGIGDFIEAISNYLYVQYKDAYYIFKEYANLLQTDSEAQISFLDVYGAKKVVSVGLFNKIVEDLIKQLLLTIQTIFTNKESKIHAITLSGGISKLQGIKNITGQVFNTHRVKIGKLSENKQGDFSDNTWATCFGMIQIALGNTKPKSFDFYTILSNIKTFIENLLK